MKSTVNIPFDPHQFKKEIQTIALSSEEDNSDGPDDDSLCHLE